MSSTQEEASLSEAIQNRLEEFGYLSNIRAQLKVCALQKSQEMNLIQKKDLNNDQMMKVLLCKELFEYYGLDNTAKMLETEVNLHETKHKKGDIPTILKKLRNQSKAVC